MKRTPLARKTPLKRGPGPKRTGRMKAVSDKRRKRDAPYKAQRQQVYERAEGLCEARCAPSCAGEAQQVHHKAGRGGGEPHALDNLVAVCFPCHLFIGAHPGWAYEVGLMRTRIGRTA